MKPLPRAQVYAMLVVVMLLWAGNSIVARAIREDIPPFSLAFVRWAGATAILLPFAWKKVRADWPLIRRHWGAILLLGMLGVGSFNALLYWGLHYTTATNALLIQAAIPTLVLVLSYAIFHMRPESGQIPGVIIATTGVLLIVFRADPAAMLKLHFGVGDGLVLCGVVVWSLYTVLLRIGPPIHPLSFLLMTFLVGVVMMLPPAIAELRHFTIHPTPAVIGSFAYVTVLPSLVAYLLFNRAVAEIGAGRTGQALGLQPLFGALLAAALLGEPLHGYHLAGMVLILAGIVLPMVTSRYAASDRPPA